MASISDEERTLAARYPQIEAYAGYTVRNPLDAWPGASAEVKVSYLVVGNTLYQLGHDVGGNVSWVRQRDFLNGGPFSAWSELGTDGIGGGIIGGYARVTDGTVQIAYPNWQKLIFNGAVGAMLALEGTDLKITAEGVSVVEIRGYVDQLAGRTVYFAVGVNGGEPVEIGNTKLSSDDRSFVVHDYAATLAVDDVVAFYISSDSRWSDLNWYALQAICLSPAT